MMIPGPDAASRILLVEDNAAQLTTLTDILESEGLAVTACRNGTEAVAVCREVFFPVAVVDLKLPDMDGLEVLARLRQANPGIKVIINTAYATLDAAIDAINREAFAFSRKLGDVEELLGHVHRAFHAHLAGYSAHLEDEVARRTTDLERSNEDLRREIQERHKAEQEREALADRLRQAHKLEAIGTLAGGIAHDFNNILGIIVGNMELAADVLAPEHPATENLEQVRLACLRARDVIRQLLGFCRRSEQRRRPLALGDVIAESIHFLRATLPSSIRIGWYEAPDVPNVLADATQMQQILINLCGNAAYAMSEGGGNLDINLSEIRVAPPAEGNFPEPPPGRYARLTVKDKGHGIPPEIRDRIFDPYFTTKPPGKGTGMGLAVVMGIVKAHDGHISLRFPPEGGTVFEILLPVSDESAGNNAGKKREDLGPAAGVRILFVDDEEAIASLCRHMLERMGCVVTAETDPVAALARFRTDPAGFDLLITDMSMPGMNGDELASAVRHIRPDMPILVCTGYSERMDPEKARFMGIRQYLEKPVYREDLIRAVRTALENRMPGTGPKGNPA